jgi:hypothetical protein
MAVRSLLTGNGHIRVRRRRYENPAGGTDAPVDDLIDVAGQGVSLAVREMCCRLAVDAGSFKRAVENLKRAAQLQLSDETLRRVVESEGRAVMAWQDQEQLELDFDAARCRTDQTPDGLALSRVYVGIDGFMLPMVTDAEKHKRWAGAKARRRKLRRQKGLRRRPLRRLRGADQRYKEFKLVAMYDQPREHKYLRVTRQGPGQAGRMLRAMAEDVRLRRCDQIAVVADGAEWIAALIEQNLPKEKTTVILDFYHAAEHVHQTRREVFGQNAGEGEQWAGELIHLLLDRPFEACWEHLVQTRCRVRSPAKRRSLDGLMQYLSNRQEKVDYARFKAMGLKIGSGPTESGCKSESRRLKGVGMRWNPANAEAMTALEALHQSNLWPAYWKSRLRLAA